MFSTGASFSSFLRECLCVRGGTGLILWVIAKEMGRSLSRMLSCKDKKTYIYKKNYTRVSDVDNVNR